MDLFWELILHNLVKSFLQKTISSSELLYCSETICNTGGKELHEFTFNAGVLVVGSLLWDTMVDRSIWREKAFGKKSKKISISVPIRYGRFSQKRNCYTMVFSYEFLEKKLYGSAFVLPFSQQALTAKDLLKEAVNLGKAEGLSNGCCKNLSNSWCIVLNWINPSLSIIKKEYFLNMWREKCLALHKNDYLSLFKSDSEKQLVFDTNGSLLFKWPDELSKLDIVFATQTRICIKDEESKRYPTITEIIDLFIKDPTYFTENLKHGISTYEDNQIQKQLFEL